MNFFAQKMHGFLQKRNEKSVNQNMYFNKKSKSPTKPHKYYKISKGTKNDWPKKYRQNEEFGVW